MTARGSEFEGMEPVAGGDESSVYKVGIYAYKVYGMRFDQRNLKIYQGITNIAASYLLENPFAFQIAINGQEYACQFRVNPILEVNRSGNRHFTRSLFVPGPSLRSLRYFNEQEFASSASNLPPTEQQLWTNIKALTFRANGIAVQSADNGQRRAIQEALERVGETILSTPELSRAGITKTQLMGLDINDNNVKLRLAPDRTCKAVITDIYSVVISSDPVYMAAFHQRKLFT